MKRFFHHPAADLGGPKKGHRFMKTHPPCRHRGPADCQMCLAQDTFWNGSKLANIERWTDVPIHGANFIVHEGHPSAEAQGLTLRPAAVALARCLPGNIRPGMRVLELGAGLGLPGRVAAFLGATVTFSENQPLVIERLQADLAAEGLNCKIDSHGWISFSGEFDCVIGSEILYDPERIRLGLALVHRVWNRRGPLLFTDPGRRADHIKKEAPLRGLRLTMTTIKTAMADDREVCIDLWSAPGNLEGFAS